MSTDRRDQRIAELEAENAQLREAVKELMRRIAELEAKLGEDSSNSSKPPSSDPPWKPPRKKDKDKKKRRRGGQPGHKKHERALLPPEKVDETVDLKPKSCRGCGTRLLGAASDGEPRRHQVVDIPQPKAHVTEYRLHGCACACGATTYAGLPDGVPRGAFGPTVAGLVGYLSGRCRLPKRLIAEMLSDIVGVEISLGTVSKLEKQVAAALEAPVEEAAEYVKNQPVVYADETSWREENGKAWLWVAVTPAVTVFRIAKSRGKKAAKALLGESFAGRVITDRWAAYGWIEDLFRQFCWAHLFRDFQGMVDRGGPGSRIAGRVLDQSRQVLRCWHRIRDGTVKESRGLKEISELIGEINRGLQAAAASGSTKTARMCAEIVKHLPSLWLFVYVPGVEPTNNAAERAIRPAVLWRKGSFGTQSKRGSRFVERILTTVATLKQQDRHVLSYLTRACEARLRGEPPPSLLPGEPGHAAARAA